ncbi:MAG: hypothetical protein FJ363_08240 [Gemmatimonadetes bacterium]|nr:hypothetical protein [Gemmatimonadota bacterium]
MITPHQESEWAVALAYAAAAARFGPAVGVTVLPPCEGPTQADRPRPEEGGGRNPRKDQPTVR